MMLLYLYTEDYDDQVASFETYRIGGPGTEMAIDIFKWESPDGDMEKTSVRMMNDVRVYAIADKYVIPGLKELAKTKFANLASSTELVLRFPTVICEIYDTTPPEDRGLRDIVTDICCLSVQEIVRHNEWSDAVRTHVDFVFDLLRVSTEISKRTKDNVVPKQKKKETPSFLH